MESKQGNNMKDHEPMVVMNLNQTGASSIMGNEESDETRVMRTPTRAWDMIRVCGNQDQMRIPKLGFCFIKKPQLKHQ